MGARIGVTTSTVIVATWGDGLFVVSGGTPDQELAKHSVRALAPDAHGGALAIVDGRSLCRRRSRSGFACSTIQQKEQ